MTSLTWPDALNTEGALPQRLERGSYQEARANNLTWDDFEIRPLTPRRRTVANPRQVAGRMLFTTDEWAVLYDFFREDLADGALPFNFPQYGAETPFYMVVRFANPPVRSPVTGDYWSVSIELEVLAVGAAIEDALLTELGAVIETEAGDGLLPE